MYSQAGYSEKESLLCSSGRIGVAVCQPSVVQESLESAETASSRSQRMCIYLVEEPGSEHRTELIVLGRKPPLFLVPLGIPQGWHWMSDGVAGARVGSLKVRHQTQIFVCKQVSITQHLVDAYCRSKCDNESSGLGQVASLLQASVSSSEK